MNTGSTLRKNALKDEIFHLNKEKSKNNEFIRLFLEQNRNIDKRLGECYRGIINTHIRDKNKLKQTKQHV